MMVESGRMCNFFSLRMQLSYIVPTEVNGNRVMVKWTTNGDQQIQTLTLPVSRTAMDNFLLVSVI